ncbi:hypothetical protein pdam_00019318 [Pocillopora damicornis]|uniref:ZP domain-containing protein n=2 Tax=Pocillopora damicornis TaxID=46731 RepID=A0A3M6V262_POCDA|nr:hypothetical protein pdam_00019318 [Pocillopora damicornis]
MRRELWSVLITFLQLMSSTSSNFLSVSQHGPRVLIGKLTILHFVSSAKSYGAPLKLTCEDVLANKIILSGISLFKMKRTVEANHVFPGIYAQSQSECQHSFRLTNNTQAAECELSFVGRKIPSDVMIVAVYQCAQDGDPRRQLVHTRASESGDLILRCGINGMIDILEIKMNNTDLKEQERERIKQQCAMKAFQNNQAPQQRIGHKQAVFCPVSRQGRDGKLKVRYQCLPALRKVLNPVLVNKTNTTDL